MHTADLHLGFRQYQRQLPGGMNQREADIAKAFERAIEKTIELKPDLVVIAGDVFHTPRPPNHAVVHACRHFAKLRREVSGAPVVMIAGNHDSPRTTESANILRVFREFGVLVADDKPARFSLRNGELSVLAVPNHMRIPLEPDSDARYNVLVLHDQVEGIVNSFGPSKPSNGDLETSALNAERWNYVALGHYHVHHQVAPNAYYAGATEYASTDIWREIDKEQGRGKGLIEYDMDSAQMTFHRIPSARQIIDLPRIDGVRKTSAQITAELLENAEAIDDKIVRQIVTDIPKHVIRDLNHREIRKLKARALNYLLDTRQPEEREFVGNTARSDRRRIPIAELVRTMLESRELTPGIEREAFVALGMQYMDDVEAAAAEKGVDEQPTAVRMETAA